MEHFGTGETEVDGDGHQARLGGCRVDLRPLDAVVGEDHDPIALRESDTVEGVRFELPRLCGRADPPARAGPWRRRRAR